MKTVKVKFSIDADKFQKVKEIANDIGINSFDLMRNVIDYVIASHDIKQEISKSGEHNENEHL